MFNNFKVLISSIKIIIHFHLKKFITKTGNKNNVDKKIFFLLLSRFNFNENEMIETRREINENNMYT